MASPQLILMTKALERAKIGAVMITGEDALLGGGSAEEKMKRRIAVMGSRSEKLTCSDLPVPLVMCTSVSAHAAL